jgi:uncharacterized protein (TIGR02594 family)
VREIVGKQHNPGVVNYWKQGKVPLTVTDDETPWCAAFVCAALELSGIRSPRTPRARGFASGATLTPCDARLGAIVVLSSDRGPASGHVGFLTGIGNGTLVLLGGNQGNRVCEAPISASKLVAMMWPVSSDWRNYPMAPQIVATGAQVSDR